MRPGRSAPRRLAGAEDDADDADPRQPRRSDEHWRNEVEALYRERAERLIGHFTSATADRETATDLVHEAFARLSALAFARRMVFSRPDSYLYRITANLVRDRGRLRQSQARCAEEQPLTSPPVHDPFVLLEQRDDLRRLEAAMLRLKPKTREIFLAKRLDGLSYAEIAERTGLSVKGVEKHMSKAIATLDRAMGRDRP